MIYKTALEINPHDHLLMAGSVLKAVDESISKTVNIPENSTATDVMEVYIQAYLLGLKGVTIFRKGSRKSQPKKLSEKT